MEPKDWMDTILQIIAIAVSIWLGAEGRQKATEAQVKKVPATRTSRNPVHPS